MFTDDSRQYNYRLSSNGQSGRIFDFSRTKVSTFGCIFLFLFLLIENPLESFIPGLGYFDELIFLVMAGVCFFNGDQLVSCLGKESISIIILSLLMVIFGLIGNWATGFQLNSEAISKEVLAFLKFPVGTVCALFLFRNIESDKVITGCDFISKVFVVSCAIFALINIFLPSAGFGHDIRKGILSFKFVFSHPTFLVFSLVMAFVAMEAKHKGISFLKVVSLVVLFLTMRDKAFGFIGFVLVDWLFNMGEKKKLLPYLVLGGSVVLIVAWPKIAEYISYSSSPRESLYATAILISVAYFPFGGGFASIASSLSGEYYSNAYSVYGLNNMPGLTPFGFYNAGDAGFAYYLGQFGFIGFALFLFIMLVIYRLTIQRLPVTSPRRSSLLYLFAYLIISLTVEASLTNATGLAASLVIALICGDAISLNGEESALRS